MNATVVVGTVMSVEGRAIALKTLYNHSKG
jgi:hypothetical protein